LLNSTSPTGSDVVGSGDELTPAEAGEILGVSPSTVRRYEERGLLTPRRLHGSGHRRYRRADVEALRDTPPAADTEGAP
jgi:excisionase family DNA binding protein